MPQKSLIITDTFKDWEDKINKDVLGNPILNTFDLDLYTTDALTLEVIGGHFYKDGTATPVIDTQLTMTVSVVNYIYLNFTNNLLEIETNLGAIPSPHLRLFDVTVNISQEITNIVDYRGWVQYWT